MGVLGQVKPEVTAQWKIRPEVYVAELDLAALYGKELRAVRYEQLSKYPSVERDFSFIFGDATTWEVITKAVRAVSPADLVSFEPAEIFRGGSVPQGKYSILMRAVFQSNERTLRDDEVQVWAQQIIRALEAAGGTWRAAADARG